MIERGIALVLALSGLAACDMGHVGNPLFWPVYAAQSGIENASYDARRARVKSYLQANRAALLAELAAPGAAFDALWRIARTPPRARGQVIADLRRLGADDWLEEATISVMVHG